MKTRKKKKLYKLTKTFYLKFKTRTSQTRQNLLYNKAILQNYQFCKRINKMKTNSSLYLNLLCKHLINNV